MEIAKSDELPWLRDFIGKSPLLQPYVSLFQLDLIIDANVILKDIYWLMRGRLNSEARSSLLEIVESQTLRVYCPAYIEIEIQGKALEFAMRYSLDVHEILMHWERYKKHITFVDTGVPPVDTNSCRDPNDLPYLRLQERLGHAILTKDNDIGAMGGRVAPWSVVARLRSYSRESAIELKLTVAGILSISLPLMVLAKAAKFVCLIIARAAARIPPGVWLAALLIIALLIVFPGTRNWLKLKLTSFSENTQKQLALFLNAIAPLVQEHQRAKSAAAKEIEKVRQAIPA